MSETEIKRATKLRNQGHTEAYITTTLGVSRKELRACLPRVDLKMTREDELRMAARQCLRKADRRVVWGNFADVLPADFLD